MTLESGTNGTKWDETLSIKTTLFPPFSEKRFSFSFFRGKTLLAELSINKCLTVIAAG
jgi:hypothetical protein